MTVDYAINGPSPQFTLTCISTGGPATTVTWTRDSEVVNGSTVLDDAETATYTHTLIVTGRIEGLYRCNMSNKLSSAAAELDVAGIVYSISYNTPQVKFNAFTIIISTLCNVLYW